MGHYKGHLLALFTVAIWGSTFICTKVLLEDFQPAEILFYRFIMGFAALWIAFPKRLKKIKCKKELILAMAGLSGVCLYYLLENIALTYTMASNIGVIISVAPFFTAVLVSFFEKEEKLQSYFFVGFVIAMTGIFLIHFNGSRLKLNPLGDLLAFLAAFVWACYSLLAKKISSWNVPILLTTRRVFFYGLIFMVPAFIRSGSRFFPVQLVKPVNLWNIAYLGLGASALCFVTWNMAVKELGAVKASLYIYMTPVVTVLASAWFLHEKITLLAGIGTVFTLTGLFLSEKKQIQKRSIKENEFAK